MIKYIWKAEEMRLKGHCLNEHPALHIETCRLRCDFWRQVPDVRVPKRGLGKSHPDCSENVKWEAEFRLIFKVKCPGDSKVN